MLKDTIPPILTTIPPIKQPKGEAMVKGAAIFATVRHPNTEHKEAL